MCLNYPQQGVKCFYKYSNWCFTKISQPVIENEEYLHIFIQTWTCVIHTEQTLADLFK